MMRRTRWLGVVAAVTAAVALSPGRSQAASGWTATSTTGVIGQVSGFSDTDAWAQGSSGFAHWNGSGWQQVPAPSGQGRVLAIADGGPGNAWAVGSVVPAGGNYHITSPQIEHWDGASWSIAPSPPITARDANLSGVVSLGSGNAWTVGNDGHAALVEHWDGASWSRVAVPDPDAGTIYRTRLTALSARSASDIWAVGTFQDSVSAPDSLYALHYDGASWHVVPMAQTGSLSDSNSPVAGAVVAAGPDDVWMVGKQNNFGTPLTLTEHWDGTTWSIVPSPFDRDTDAPNSIASGSLVAVTARASNDVWAAGSSFTFTDGDPFGVYHALLIHWNGRRWTQETAPTTGSFNAVTGISTTPGGHVIWATNAGSPGLLTHP
jgi:hypothetical protein